MPAIPVPLRPLLSCVGVCVCVFAHVGACVHVRFLEPLAWLAALGQVRLRREFGFLYSFIGRTIFILLYVASTLRGSRGLLTLSRWRAL
jgi:hypothetical protein